MEVGIIIVDSVGRASVRLFRVCDCVPHGTFGDMNGEYRSPGPATRRAVPTEMRKLENKDPSPSGEWASGDHLEWLGCAGTRRWNHARYFFLFSRNPNA